LRQEGLQLNPLFPDSTAKTTEKEIGDRAVAFIFAFFIAYLILMQIAWVVRSIEERSAKKRATAAWRWLCVEGSWSSGSVRSDPICSKEIRGRVPSRSEILQSRRPQYKGEARWVPEARKLLHRLRQSPPSQPAKSLQ
jgi:hypothetical protein